jgi:hypothetical protein
VTERFRGASATRSSCARAIVPGTGPAGAFRNGTHPPGAQPRASCEDRRWRARTLPTKRPTGWSTRSSSATPSPSPRLPTCMAARSATRRGSSRSSRSSAARSSGRGGIQSHNFICSGVEIEDEVFVGHSTIFINERLPRATTEAGRLKRERTGHFRPRSSSVAPRSARGLSYSAASGSGQAPWSARRSCHTQRCARGNGCRCAASGCGDYPDRYGDNVKPFGP